MGCGGSRQHTRMAPEEIRDFSKDSRVDELFQNTSRCTLKSALRKEFEARLRAERQELRSKYEAAVKEARAGAMADCAEAVARLRPAAEDRGEGESRGVAEEACRLRNEVAALRNAKRPRLDTGDSLPFDNITYEALKEISEDAKALQEYAAECTKRLTMTLVPMTMGGAEYPVEVKPGIETVNDLVMKIWKQHNTPHSNLRILAPGPVIMNPPDVLMNYDLSSGLTLVVLNDPVDSQLLRLRFDDPENMALDSHSGLAGEWLNPTSMESVELDGRQAVVTSGHCTLRLAQPVQLDGQFTLSLWTFAPNFNERNSYRVSVDGPTPESRILLCFCNKKIGYYCRNHDDHQSPQQLLPTEAFDASELAPGWHHLAAVGGDGRITYYVDGRDVGFKTCGPMLLNGTIDFVGNTAIGTLRDEAFSVMSDLRIFGAAASAEQIRHLAVADLR
mmetsp:Transcript_13044/g.46394  ORF Transcript_13044/g.46394 Transcript_13044/m.46394 type:complete len:447 (-) Transcript_13044:239-1579(-)